MTKFALSLLAVSVLASCTKKQYSPDTALNSSAEPSVYIGSDNHVLYAFNPSTGDKNWEYSLPQAIYASPVAYGGRLYVATTYYASTTGLGDTLYKFNSRTGELVKKAAIAEGLTFNIKATPVADGKYIYVAGMNDSLYALDTGTLAVVWRFGADGPLESSPTIYNGQVYFASTAGTVYAADKSTGVFTWSYSPGLGKSFTSSPSVAAPYLYLGCSDSSMYCIHLTSATTTGVLKWVYQTKGVINSSPATIAGRCIFGSNDFNVYCLDSASGMKMWSFPTASNINSSPMISVNKDLVYIASNDYNLYALNIQFGTQKWKFSTNGLIKSSPLDYKGTVFIGSYDKYLYAIDGQQGTLKWSKNVDGQIECSPSVDDLSGAQYNSQMSGATN